MPARLAHAPVAEIRVRKAERADLDVLTDLEQRVFATDRLSRRSLRRFLNSPTAEVIVAEDAGRLAGTAIVLFRPRSLIARLYSLAVAPQMGGRGAGTIFTASGPGGCEPFGMGVAVRRHGLEPELYVSHPGPYFLETAQSADKRRVMRVTQLAFQREAKALAIPTHLTPVSESVLMRAFAAGSVVIVLVSGYHMVDRGRPHWIFAFGRDGRHVLMHDPAAIRDDQGMAAAAETYAMPWPAFERVTRLAVGRRIQESGHISGGLPARPHGKFRRCHGLPAQLPWR